MSEERPNRRRGSIAFLVLLWLLTQAVTILRQPLLDDVDSTHSEAAREMLLRHDFVTLYVDGVRYLDKPPLPYWLAAGSMAIFGQHDWAIRIPLALAMLVLILYVYRIGARLYGERAGFYAGCAMATAIGPFVYTRFFIPDVMLALWITVAFDMTLRMTEESERGRRASVAHAAVFALVCTAAVLTKGLIGVVFPLALLVGFLLFTGRLRLLLRMHPALGTLLFLVTAVPWHWLAVVQNAASGESKGFFWFYFINDQVNRYLNTRIPRDYDKVPLLLFYGLLFVWVLPWGVFLWHAAAERVRGWRAGNHNLRTPGVLLAWWTVLIVGFFTFSTRQEYYTLPAIPALALLTGAALARRDGEQRRQWAYSALAVSGVLLGVLCLAVAAVSHPPAHEELWQTLQKHPEDYALSFGHLFDFTESAFGFFRLPLLLMGVSLLVPTVAAWWLKRNGRSYAANVALALGMCAVLCTIHVGLEYFYPILGSKPLALALEKELRPGDRIVIDGQYSNNGGVNFYTHQPVWMLNGRTDTLWYGSLYADAPNRFETTTSLLAAWKSPQRVFFITHSAVRTDRWLALFGGKRIVENGGKFVLLNHD
ncbi:ArnT family glycosyltransferase [Terriglobus aquaticus]|uniref:ArnT family glycosyltransferase n=1 Tax=Terriglobus aquaticus TaxID=940139 RepID=A0ABW9KJM4_9BACT|nr:glycosyltransferase family 39 protein [Terriglobus aquaticus]